MDRCGRGSFGFGPPITPALAGEHIENCVGSGPREKAGVTRRWHDSRHTFITELAEWGEASDVNRPGFTGGMLV